MEYIKGKKRRRDERKETPKHMRMTERDKDIIEAVHLYRVLRQDQLETLFFGSQTAAQRVLARLYDHHFLERKFLPVLYGRSPTLYVLDKRGAELLRAERGHEDLVWYSSSKDLKTEFLEHTAAINDFRVSVVVAARRQGLEVITWASEGQLRSDYDRIRIGGGVQEFSIIPDGYFLLGTPLGRAHLFVEVDRGTETLDRFKQKVKAYIAYHEGGGYEKRYGTKSLRILTVVTSEGRLQNLRRAVQEVTHGGMRQQRFWFALASKLTPEMVLSEPVWYVGDTETQQMLVSRRVEIHG